MASRAKIGHDAHTKGFAYQHKIAMKFSKWSGTEYHSTPASGSLHWSPDVYGDVMTTNTPSWHSLIECKKYNEASVFQYCEGTHNFRETQKEETWWAQTMRESLTNKAAPMLVYAGYRTKDFLVLPFDEDIAGMLYSKGYFSIHNKIYYYDISGKRHYSDTMLTTLDNFFETVSLDKYLSLQDKITDNYQEWDFEVKNRSLENEEGINIDSIF